MTPQSKLLPLAITAAATLVVMGGCATWGPGSEFIADLTGSNEVPSPGDPDGEGAATIRIDSATNEVCYELSVSNIENPMAAHIHEAPVGENGPPVVTLDTPTGGASQGCVTVPAAQIGEILGNPEGYYVNVHTPDFRGGAIRGQLRR